ncbi:MAG: hypothetical protein UV17_C0060G0010 [Candidatus Gottesmanbacteria bacterium GW2011_GWA1_42_26]|nr:MAG: hypothetical protein UV17_C0060G0010 [Candidatus Gottesmanbacteria bacterium GW2011_GWA1_42_26]
MADDPSQSVAGPIASDRNIIPPAESASSPLNRPVSTILADSPTEPKTPLADPAKDYTVPVSADFPVATEPASIASPPSTAPADASIEVSAKVDSEIPVPDESPDQSATVPTEAQGEASPPPFPDEIAVTPPQPKPQVAPAPSPDPAERGSIQDSLPPDQSSKVQPEASESAPDAQASPAPETASQSAEIKPEPPQGTQEAPLADPGTQISPKTFGDLVSDQPSPVSPPVSPQAPQSPQAPKSSFGDLVGKQPTINIGPIEAPKPVQSPLPADLSAEVSTKAEALAKEGVSPQPPAETVIEVKADFSSKRQQALQTRRKKREDHLVKIIALVGQKGKVSNKDVRDALRVSQSTASDYLHALVKSGKIKKEGKAKATIYLL